MNIRPEDWLTAAAAIPLFSSMGVIVAILIGNRRTAFALTGLGLAGGFACGTVLAAILANGQEPALPIRQMLWTWFSFSTSQSPSITFGLEATWIKAALVGLTGGLALIGLGSAITQRIKPLSEDLILSTSLLYAAGTVFVFAPSLAQALIGWACVSILAGILIRLSHRRAELDTKPSEFRALQSTKLHTDNLGYGQGGWPQLIEFVSQFVEQYFDRAWRAITMQFPGWVGEQTEVLESSPVSFQLLTTILCVSAILLTWLL